MRDRFSTGLESLKPLVAVFLPCSNPPSINVLANSGEARCVIDRFFPRPSMPLSFA